MKIITWVRQLFCSHKFLETEIIEDPSPLSFVNIKAKCENCGLESDEINKRAHDKYKMDIAEDFLFDRNRKKFPEFFDAYIRRYSYPISLEILLEGRNCGEEINYRFPFS